MKLIREQCFDLTENRLIPEHLKNHKAFQGKWWEKKSSSNCDSVSITEKLENLLKRLKVKKGVAG